MSNISKDISVLGNHDTSIWYTHTCSCGCGEQITIEVTTPYDMELVTLELYAEVSCPNNEIKLNTFKQFLSNIRWRVVTMFTVLFKGTISLQTGLLIDSKQGIEDYITALTEASKVFKEVDDE